MNGTRRVTANLPAELLAEAQAVTKKGITDTLVHGLTLVRRSRAYEKAMKLKGKLHLDLDIDELRGRPRR